MAHIYSTRSSSLSGRPTQHALELGEDVDRDKISKRVQGSARAMVRWPIRPQTSLPHASPAWRDTNSFQKSGALCKAHFGYLSLTAALCALALACAIRGRCMGGAWSPLSQHCAAPYLPPGATKGQEYFDRPCRRPSARSQC